MNIVQYELLLVNMRYDSGCAGQLPRVNVFTVNGFYWKKRRMLSYEEPTGTMFSVSNVQ